MTTAVRGFVLILALAACSSSSPPPAFGEVGASLEGGSLRAALGELAPLIDALEEGDPAAAEAIEERVRRMANELGSDRYAETPLAAGRLRARVIFVALGEPEQRRQALAECRTLLDALLEGRGRS